MQHQDEFQGRRKYPRRELRKSIGVLSRGTYFIGQSTEIGEGGISVSSDLLLTEGTCVLVNFQIPGGSFVSLRAMVRSTKKEEAGLITHGLSFENISFSSKRQIRAYVSARTGS